MGRHGLDRSDAWREYLRARPARADFVAPLRSPIDFLAGAVSAAAVAAALAFLVGHFLHHDIWFVVAVVVPSAYFSEVQRAARIRTATGEVSGYKKAATT